MKSIRFAKVVEACGQPEVYLLLTDPAKDETFQQALKSTRIMTLHEKFSGAKTGYGTVGYDAKARGQLLAFPRSLSAFADSQVIGIKYHLLKTELSEPAKPPPSKPKEELFSEDEIASAPKKKPFKTSRPTPVTKSKPEPTKVIQFHKKPAPPVHQKEEVDEDEDEDEDSEIKAQVRRAMKALEDGKQVAAFNILKRIVDPSS